MRSENGGTASPGHAVYDGRFQPLHVGHLAVMRAILRAFDDPLTVMIISSLPNAGERDAYSAHVDGHHAPGRNPLTWYERFTMIRLALDADEELREISVVGIPRPDLYWEIARAFYPPDRYMCVTDKDDYERAKVTFWASLGERTRVLPSAGLPTVSATAVKAAMKSGDDYRGYIPEAAIAYFESIDGPARFRRAEL